MDREEIFEACGNLREAFEGIKREVRQRLPHLYERWKAGGFLIDDTTVSMYPTFSEVEEELIADVESFEECPDCGYPEYKCTCDKEEESEEKSEDSTVS